VVSLDNSEAEIYVGQEVPFVTGQFTNTGLSNQEGTVNPFQTISRNEVGIRLQVTPHINEGDAVVLDINQEVSAIAPVTGAVDLITNKRTVKTSVMVPDNTILVLGGLITDDLRETEEAVPGLSRIPGLGRLFRYNSTESVQRSLMIFIRPRILTDISTMQAISGGKYDYLRARQLEFRETPRGMTPVDQMPLLPELYEYLQTPPASAPADKQK
jgi:general secretion pathway protein D